MMCLCAYVCGVLSKNESDLLTSLFVPSNMKTSDNISVRSFFPGYGQKTPFSSLAACSSLGYAVKALDLTQFCSHVTQLQKLHDTMAEFGFKYTYSLFVLDLNHTDV